MGTSCSPLLGNLIILCMRSSNALNRSPASSCGTRNNKQGYTALNLSPASSRGTRNNKQGYSN